jgi:inosine-uridine nucleoside N-ribohydrolase
MTRIFFLLTLLLCFEISQAQPSKIIFDTDFALDVDDAGSLAMLHTFINRHECQLLGIVVSSSLNSYDGKWAVPAIDAINTWYGHKDIPIGIYKGLNPIKDDSSHYTRQVQAAFPHSYHPGDSILEGYKLYRKILASQPDESVKVLTVGFLNNLEQLLKSGPDEYSSLTGSKLVKQKVKEWICMGGSYPTGNEEFNFNIYPQSTKYVLSHWPTKVTFIGFELGEKIESGGILKKRYKKEENPIALSFYYYCQGNNRSSWDELATIYAVKGLGKMFAGIKGWNTEYNIDKTTNPAERPHGKNVWLKDPAGSHQYLTLQIPNSSMEEILDLFISAPPVGH